MSDNNNKNIYTKKQTEVDNIKIDDSILYQVTSERYNAVQQQSQTALNISAVSILAFFTIIGAVFASMSKAENDYILVADISIIIASALAIRVSYVCKRILNNCSEVMQQYEEKLKQFEDKHCDLFKPHRLFSDIWKQKFAKYEPYKATSDLLTIAEISYHFYAAAALYSIIMN